MKIQEIKRYGETVYIDANTKVFKDDSSATRHTFMIELDTDAVRVWDPILKFFTGGHVLEQAREAVLLEAARKQPKHVWN